MHVLRPVAQAAHERLDRIASRPAVARELLYVQAAGRKHLVGQLRDQAELGLGAGQCALRVEHPGEPRFVGNRLAQRLRYEDGRERQCAKKTVSRSPCSRMSKRRVPFSSASAK